VKTLGGGMSLNRFNPGKKNFAGRLAETDFTERLPAKSVCRISFDLNICFILANFAHLVFLSRLWMPADPTSASQALSSTTAAYLLGLR
jgi:hypothetical protein